MKPVRTHAMPKTIDALRSFCLQKGMPLEQMRFFIGEDCREPSAFGVYRDDDGQFIVYKNKSKGARAVRYRGRSERRAVAEIMLKLGNEIALRRAALFPNAPKTYTRAQSAGWLAGRGTLTLLKHLFWYGGIFTQYTTLIYLTRIEDNTGPNSEDAPAPIPVENWRAADWKDWDTSLTEWSWDW